MKIKKEPWILSF